MYKVETSGENLSGVEMIHTPIFRTLTASDIECRTCNLSPDRKKVKLLLYKDARVDMAILDETVGADRWQRLHEELKGNLYCKVGIKTAEDAARFSEEEHKENKRKATRRKANAGSVWATGEEAGIAAEPKAEEPKNTKASEDTNDDDGDSNIPDSVLDMFGD